MPGETVLRHWGSPHGVGVLTDRRLLLLGHPRPLHRPVDWATDLRRVKSLEVVELDGLPQYGYISHATYGGQADAGRYFRGNLPGSFDVRVDGVTAFRGTPGASQKIQGWIDATKADLSRGHATPPE